MHKVNGACHCGDIQVDMELTREPHTYDPRACDCDFCRKHGAAYVSEPRGSLRIRIKDEREIARYRQGSGIAERLYATVNARIVAGGVNFGAQMSVSPKKLSDSAKIGRWQDIWLSDVAVLTDDA